MEAKITNKMVDNLNINHRKENKLQDEYSVIVLDDSFGDYTHIPITVRIYGTNAKNYACVWIYGKGIDGINISSSGSAGGYGYHRPSAAVADALNNAGIELSSNISGVGNKAIMDAISAIARSMGYKKFYVHHAHA